MSSRLTRSIQPAPAASQPPTLHSRLPRPIHERISHEALPGGSLTFARPIIPFARLSPEWNREPSALPPGFAPHRYQRRTPGQGQAHGHWPGITPSNSLDLHLGRSTHCPGLRVAPSWTSCSRQRVPLPSQSAYQSREQDWTLSGFPCSARMRHGRGGCLLYSGAAVSSRSPRPRRSAPAASQRPALYPTTTSHRVRVGITKHTKIHSHPPVRPSPCP